MGRSHPADAAFWLKNVAFFEGFTDDELRRVASLAEEVDADTGAEIIDQGRPGLEAFVILEGSASVVIGGVKKAEVTSGDIIGEMALIDHRPRMATITAQSPMRLLRFDAGQFRRLLDEMPLAQTRVMEKLVERLRARDADLAP